MPRLETFALLAALWLPGAACKGVGTSAAGDAGASAGPSIPGLGTLIDLVGFEGEIELSIGLGSSAGLKMAPLTMTLLARGQRIAYDMGPVLSGGSRIVVDGGERKAYFINDKAAEYTVTDLGATTGTTTGTATTSTAAAPKITKGRGRDRIAGYDCEVWEVTEGSHTVEVCAARGLSFLGIGLAFGNITRGASGWASAIASAGYFPMRAVERDTAGAEVWRCEVTRIDKKSVPEAKVSVPAGYVDRTVPVVPVAPKSTTAAPMTL